MITMDISAAESPVSAGVTSKYRNLNANCNLSC